ncbi:hypothetical protein OKW38_006805 [Paraburkholderia sp. MM5496-R1]
MVWPVRIRLLMANASVPTHMEEPAAVVSRN